MPMVGLIHCHRGAAVEKKAVGSQDVSDQVFLVGIGMNQ